MGFFNFFKKKAQTHKAKVNIAYGKYNPKYVELVFPGNQAQASNIIVSLAKIFGLDLDICVAEEYYELLTIYADVVIRRVITQSSEEHIFKSLQVKYAELVKNKEIAMKVTAFVTICMKNKDFVINSEEDMSVLDILLEMYATMEENIENNQKAENENLDDPDYGLVVSKPIYTQGVNGSYGYLNSLKTTSGENLTWTRHGSTSAEGINGMIDVYVGTLPSGETYKTLYINMYGSCNSTTIPKGFIK